MRRLLLPGLIVLLASAVPLTAQEKRIAAPPAPTAASVAYGDHPRQVLDFYQAKKSDAPTALVLYIHGGGWVNGDKKIDARPYLNAGISVAAINYRMAARNKKDANAAPSAVELKVVPPVKAPLEDAARALQFIRSKAKEWNLDKKRVGATGGSAGGCSSLWLAFHDDMAKPNSSDPIARESTRLYCAAVNGAQTSLDPKELREWMPNYSYGAHAFGLPNFQAYYEARDKILPWIKEYSPIEHVSKDDPPIFMIYNFGKDDPPPVVGTKQKDPTHSAILGIKLKEKLDAVGVECVLDYPGHMSKQYPTIQSFLIDRLKK
jgi:acetyl esterase/lipase